MASSTSIEDQAASLLRSAIGLDGPIVPDRLSWSQWLFHARSERVLPLLYQLVDQVETDLDDAQRVELKQLCGTALMRCVQLEHHLVRATQSLEAHGVRAVTLKGSATAHLDYANPSMREYNDIDLLVSPDDLATAIEALGGLGWAQGYALPIGHERFTHAVTFVRDRMELDLHQRLARRAIGYLVPVEGLLERSVPFVVAGAELRALDPRDRLIHAAVHFAGAERADRRISSIVDVLVLASAKGVDVCGIAAESTQFRVWPLVEFAIREAFRLARVPLPVSWAREMTRNRRERSRFVERAYLGPGTRPISRELVHLRYLDLGAGRRWRDRADYIRGFLLTDPADLKGGSGVGVGARFRYVGSKLRG